MCHHVRKVFQTGSQRSADHHLFLLQIWDSQDKSEIYLIPQIYYSNNSSRANTDGVVRTVLFNTKISIQNKKVSSNLFCQPRMTEIVFQTKSKMLACYPTYKWL